MERAAYRRVATVATGVLAILLLVAAALGPLGMGRITFAMSTSAENQYAGGDAVTALVAIMLLGALVAWRDNERLVPLLIAGADLYLIYTFVSVVFGQNSDKYDGANGERYFPLFAAITGLSTLSMMFSLLSRPENATFPVTRGVRRTSGIVAIVMGALFAAMWGGQIAALYRGDDNPAYEADRALFWLIKYLDYGFLIPFLLTAGFGVIVGRDGRFDALLTILFSFGSCLMPAIGAMALSQLLHDEPDVTAAFLAFPLGMAVLNWVLASIWLRAADRAPATGQTARPHND